jgi:enoyl-[acyl-carrier-protein] reductase (NADH)
MGSDGSSLPRALSGVRIAGCPRHLIVFGIHAKAIGISPEQFRGMMEGTRHTRRLTTLKELTDAAVFAASDLSKGMTGAVINLTGGKIAD